METTVPVAACQPLEGCENGTRGSRGVSADLLSCRCRETTIRTASHHLENPGKAASAERGRSRNRNASTTRSLFWPRRLTKLGNSLSLHLLTLLILISCCCSFSTAQPFLPPSIADLDVSDGSRSAILTWPESGTIIADRRPPPPGAFWSLETAEEAELRKRQSSSDLFLENLSSSPASSTSNKPTSTSSTVAPSATTSGTSASGTSSPISLPSPFDSSLGTNFTTTTCPRYINSFLTNATFKSCLPFSLLVTSSISFFQASKSIVRITQTLDATCAANVTSCTALMSSFANNLTTAANCGADYAAQNPLVLEAYTGFLTYKPMYQASCIKNPATSAYCFAEAITNASSPTDAYIYYLPLNQSLPGGSQPTCDKCLQNTMAIFNAAAANRSQPVAWTYISAAQQINSQCGPNFVSASIPAPISSAAVPRLGTALGLPGLLTLLLACLGHFLL